MKHVRLTGGWKLKKSRLEQRGTVRMKGASVSQLENSIYKVLSRHHNVHFQLKVIIFRLPIEIVAEPLKQHIWKVLQYRFKPCSIDYSVYSTQLIYIYIGSKICCLATFTAKVIWWRPPSSLSRRPNQNFGAVVESTKEDEANKQLLISSPYKVGSLFCIRTYVSFASSLALYNSDLTISTFTWISPIPKAVIYSYNSTKLSHLILNTI